MSKKIFPFLALALLVCGGFFACKKSSNNNPNSSDPSKNYFPLQLGKYVDYNVDSTIYIDSTCNILQHSSQIRYSVTDTFRDNQNRLSYIIDVNNRPNGDSTWAAQGVIFVTPTDRDIEYQQSNVTFVKLIFPIVANETWKGNSDILTGDSTDTYFTGWNYQYQNYQQSYNNGLVNFDNTVAVLEDNETRYSNTTDTVAANAIYRTYATEVYAYNVGMVYREWTHWETAGVNNCKQGYTVIMRATDHN